RVCFVDGGCWFVISYGPSSKAAHRESWVGSGHQRRHVRRSLGSRYDRTRLLESCMVGPNAITVKSDPIRPPDTAATRRYMIEYFDWTVANSEFQHGYFHRLEWLMRFVYYKRWGQDALMFPSPSNWNTSPYDTKVWG